MRKFQISKHDQQFDEAIVKLKTIGLKSKAIQMVNQTAEHQNYFKSMSNHHIKAHHTTY